MQVATCWDILPLATLSAYAEIIPTMRSPFYQANFCAECGNQIKARSVFRIGYFCDECASRLRQRKFFTPLAALLLVGSLAVFAFNYNRGDNQISTLNSETAPSSVSAQDSIVNQSFKMKAEGQARVFCGAKTRRGTPCRHLVQPGQRCAQHRGKPSLLDKQSANNTNLTKSESR